MPLLNVGDTVMVSHVGSLCGQRTINTFYYRVAATAPAADMNAALLSFHAALGVSPELRFRFLGATPNNYTLTQAWYQVIHPLRYRKVVVGVNQGGQFLDNAATANVQASITRASELAGRTHIGGVRIPCGTTTASTDNGIITGPLKAKLDDLAIAMALTVITTVAPVCTFAPLIGLSADGFQREMAFAFAQDTTRVIRRRTVGLGE